MLRYFGEGTGTQLMLDTIQIVKPTKQCLKPEEPQLAEQPLPELAGDLLALSQPVHDSFLCALAGADI